jgi:DNA end-binding protein Ku
MADRGSRSFWKGYLKLSLVNCPVQMMPATTEAERVRFHTLNRATGNRVASHYVDAETGDPVEDEDQAKGYESAEGKFLILEDEELDAVALESNRTIDIDVFVPKSSIEWIWYDKPHYLMPSEPVGEEAFAVIREAMAKTETVGISRVVLYRRERAVMLEPADKGIILWTLRYGDEVRAEKDYFGAIEPEKLDSKLLAMTVDLIGERTKPWKPDMVNDPVQAKLKQIIKAKTAKRPAPKKKTKAEEPSNVVNIMDALRNSLKGQKAAKNSGLPPKAG